MNFSLTENQLLSDIFIVIFICFIILLIVFFDIARAVFWNSASSHTTTITTTEELREIERDYNYIDQEENGDLWSHSNIIGNDI